MQTDQRFKMLLDATPAQLSAVDAALAGKTCTERPTIRLWRMGEAATETGISRTTLWRAIREGRLRTVEIRKGSFRIPEEELIRFANGGTE
jgi:excisionase family DNA binding protein